MEKEQIREVIARRVAMELHDGDVVNLGIRFADFSTELSA